MKKKFKLNSRRIAVGNIAPRQSEAIGEFFPTADEDLSSNTKILNDAIIRYGEIKKANKSKFRNEKSILGFGISFALVSILYSIVAMVLFSQIESHKIIDTIALLVLPLGIAAMAIWTLVIVSDKKHKHETLMPLEVESLIAKYKSWPQMKLLIIPSMIALALLIVSVAGILFVDDVQAWGTTTMSVIACAGIVLAIFVGVIHNSNMKFHH